MSNTAKKFSNPFEHPDYKSPFDEVYLAAADAFGESSLFDRICDNSDEMSTARAVETFGPIVEDFVLRCALAHGIKSVRTRVLKSGVLKSVTRSLIEEAMGKI